MESASQPLAAAIQTLVPEGRREAAQRALHAAFGVTAELKLERLPGGATAAIRPTRATSIAFIRLKASSSIAASRSAISPG